MIKITYEYNCDFCDAEILPKMTIGYTRAMVVLQPEGAPITFLGNRVICKDCYTAAIAGIEKEDL